MKKGNDSEEGENVEGKNAYRFLEKLKAHEGKTTVLTGAGISTPSGIPDFRSPTGIYSKYDPEELFGLDNFLKNPSYFYTFALEYLFTMKNAKPNSVHLMLKKLEDIGLIKGIVTQNIDMLHEKAGSKNVANAHGSMKTGHCLNCWKEYSLNEMEERALKSNDKVARCDCGGLIKPDIVFFGEPLPEKDVKLAYEMLESSTLVVAMGTTLAIYPVGAFPEIVLRNGGELVIVNKGKTAMDSRASEVYGVLLEEFAEEILKILK
jgi:NAD-dependent deacetylase